MDALQFDNVRYSYAGGAFTMAAMSFRIPHGEFVSVLGANGAGKTTVFRLAAGLLQPDSGNVHVMGAGLSHFPRTERARTVAFVGQHGPPAIDMTVAEYVLLGRVPYAGAFAFTSDRDRELVDEAMTVTECSRSSHAPLGTLSGGELQRVLVARALAQEPRVLLLDEPNSHLDLAHRLSLFSALQTWQKRTGATVIASTHDMNLAAMYSTHVIVLSHGELIASGSPAAVLRRELLDSVFGVRTFITEGFYDGAPAIHVKPA